MRIGANMYGLGTLASKDFEDTARELASYGFGSVEPIVMLNCDRAAMEGNPYVPACIWRQDELIGRSRFLRENYDMAITSCHLGGLPGADFSGKTDDMIELIQQSDVRDFVVSRMLRSDEECKRDAEIFNKTAEKLAPYGGRLLYHNHETEQQEITVNGESCLVLDRFLSLCEESVKLEIDVGWVMFSGLDPVAFVRAHRDRLPRLHLKDFRKDFSLERRERDNVAVGTGALPLREILTEAAAIGLRDDRIIIDQDCSDVSILADLHTGILAVDSIFEGLAL